MEENTSNNKFSNFFENLLIKLGIKKPLGRRPFHVGWMAPGRSIDELRLYLHSEWGFGRNDKKVIDKELVLNWCRITEQHKKYSIQVYTDGEIRGFMENIPVTGVLEKPSEMGEKEAKDDLLKFLGEFSVEKKFVSRHTSESKQIEPEPEIIHEVSEQQ